MRGLGILLMVLGIGSFVLHYMEREFVLLGWVDSWGAEVGIGIRIGVAALGVLLFLLSMRRTA